MSKKTDQELLAELESLGLDDVSAVPPSGNITSTESSAKATTTAVPSAPRDPRDTETDDPLRDLQAQLAAKPASAAAAAGTSRPGTPRLSSSTTSAGTTRKAAEYTPASSGQNSGRNSEERMRGGGGSGSGSAGLGVAQQGRMSGEARMSGEGGRAYHSSFVPGSGSGSGEVRGVEVVDQAGREGGKREGARGSGAGGGGGGGWFGSIWGTATAAVKQAESLAKEITGNEEAMKWAEQVRGNVGKLQSFGTDLSSRALPTFTTLLQHIAPPISAHERLQIHTTHDIHNYPSLDPLIYSTFSRIMSQVEGGDLMVIQRGTENKTRARTTSEPHGYRGGVLGSSGPSGWTDGPWWREEHVRRDLGVVEGLKEGSRLARVSAEAYAREFFDGRGGVEGAAKRAAESLTEMNPTRSSDIFLAIQAVGYARDGGMFAGGAAGEEGKGGEKGSPGTEGDDEEEEEEVVCFAIYLHDPLHTLSFSTLSQPFPAKWARWLDAATTSSNTSNTSPTSSDPADGLPESIREIIAAGGLDPREWVAEWIEEVLSLGVGVLAQQYVARRMGVGEGGLGRGRRVADAEEAGAGEAARVI
ncbi:hypothetical protein LTR86_008775 [Recurvomyces mirabilis]|nr:hypothetical protein LTR86_008775 [Recurvomyces mirabilis]